jgi:predicted phosphodiesterase
MRVAALYDIHGNLPALEAVLEDVASADADRIVIGGDVVFGPMTCETLRCLMSLDRAVRYIYGNAEVAVLTEMAGGELTIPFPEPLRQTLQWEAAQLREFETMLAGWPLTITEEIAGLGKVLFCHATPRDENAIFLRSTPEDVLLPVFEPLDASVVVCGHTHMQFDRTVGRVRVVNAGSVGMPFGAPGADWLLLGPGIELRHTDYDLGRAADRVRASAYPQAQEFAATNILQPPSESAMLEVFGQVAMK